MWFYEQTSFEKMRTSTGRIPRYLDWYEGLSSKVKRPHFERQLFHISQANIKEDPVPYFVAEEQLREKGFIAANFLEYVCDAQKLQSVLNTPTYDMLAEFTPVLMKFGVVPCSFLKDQFRDLNPKIVYVVPSFPKLDDIEPEIMEKIIQESDEIVLKYSAKKLAEKKMFDDQCKFYFMYCLYLQDSLCYYTVYILILKL